MIALGQNMVTTGTLEDEARGEEWRGGRWGSRVPKTWKSSSVI